MRQCLQLLLLLAVMVDIQAWEENLNKMRMVETTTTKRPPRDVIAYHNITALRNEKLAFIYGGILLARLKKRSAARLISEVMYNDFVGSLHTSVNYDELDLKDNFLSNGRKFYEIYRSYYKLDEVKFRKYIDYIPKIMPRKVLACIEEHQILYLQIVNRYEKDSVHLASNDYEKYLNGRFSTIKEYLNRVKAFSVRANVRVKYLSKFFRSILFNVCGK